MSLPASPRVTGTGHTGGCRTLLHTHPQATRLPGDSSRHTGWPQHPQCASIHQYEPALPARTNATTSVGQIPLGHPEKPPWSPHSIPPQDPLLASSPWALQLSGDTKPTLLPAGGDPGAWSSPRKVLEMYSDTWFPERLVSDRCDSSRFSIRLNCGWVAGSAVWGAGRTSRGGSGVPSARQGDHGKVPYLVGGHLADRVPGLQRLQLVQAPIQLLQGLPRELLVGIFCWGHLPAWQGTRQQRAHPVRGAWCHPKPGGWPAWGVPAPPEGGTGGRACLGSGAQPRRAVPVAWQPRHAACHAVPWGDSQPRGQPGSRGAPLTAGLLLMEGLTSTGAFPPPRRAGGAAENQTWIPKGKAAALPRLGGGGCTPGARQDTAWGHGDSRPVPKSPHHRFPGTHRRGWPCSPRAGCCSSLACQTRGAEQL